MSTQIEVKEPIKLLNKDGSLTQPGWAKRNIIEYNRVEMGGERVGLLSGRLQRFHRAA